MQVTCSKFGKEILKLFSQPPPIPHNVPNKRKKVNLNASKSNAEFPGTEHRLLLHYSTFRFLPLTGTLTIVHLLPEIVQCFFSPKFAIKCYTTQIQCSYHSSFPKLNATVFSQFFYILVVLCSYSSSFYSILRPTTERSNCPHRELNENAYLTRSTL